MSRAIGELLPEEENLLGIVRDTPEQEAAKEKERAEKVELQREFLINLMQAQTFRDWLMERLVEFGTFSNAFCAGPNGTPDPMATQFQLGMKAAGWRLWEIFDDVAPELASRMRRGVL